MIGKIMEKNKDSVTEVFEGIQKVIITGWVLFAITYFASSYVGAGEGKIDANLVWGFLSGTATTIFAVYFGQKKNKDGGKNEK